VVITSLLDESANPEPSDKSRISHPLSETSAARTPQSSTHGCDLLRFLKGDG